MQLTDSIGRTINYLRLSVTDRCNMRCFYCMPPEGIVKKEHDAVLSYEELQLISETAVELGIEKIRITGGEPLVRAGIVDFLEKLAAIPGLRHLALTTNGLLLEEMAADLYEAGVQRLNVSLDSLNPQTFSEITRGGDLPRFWPAWMPPSGPDSRHPRSTVSSCAGSMTRRFSTSPRGPCSHGNSIRFIEYMPAVKEEGWQRYCISGEEILQRITARYTLEAGGQGALFRTVAGFPHPRRTGQHRHHHRRLRPFLQRLQPHPGHVHRPGQGLPVQRRQDRPDPLAAAAGPRGTGGGAQADRIHQARASRHFTGRLQPQEFSRCHR